jgi:hypothetical protein
MLAFQSIMGLIVHSNGRSCMTSESRRADQERQVSPHVQEIEYALILHRMINAVRDDPEQMRATIYEFARARLKIDTSEIAENERERLSGALETAIVGVEQFTRRREDRLLPLDPQLQITPVVSSGTSIATVQTSRLVTLPRTAMPVQEDILIPTRNYHRAETVPLPESKTRRLSPSLARFCAGLVAFGIVGGLIYSKDQISLLATQWGASHTTKPLVAVAPDSAPPAVAKPVAPKEPSFQLPRDYGVYALVNDALNELHPIPERVPDRRIAVSTPVDQPSRTVLSNGNTRFVVFRRDFIGNSPDRIEVRVVARVARVISFDAKGRPNISPVSDAWNIRNVSYEFRVRPLAGNPEMLLVQSDKPDFALPAGRYVLVLKDQGYDFSITGNVDEPAQCLERTDAANGSFYSECLKP